MGKREAERCFVKQKTGNKHKGPGGQKGFTLLEILVVLTIMGFLIAMVAPRLATVGDSASETVCNSNKGRYRTYVSTFFNQNDGKYPSNLTAMLITDSGSGAAHVAPASDENPDTGKEVLAKGHNMMYKFMPHTLNAAEAEELNSLGIDKMFNLNDYTGLNTTGWDNITNFNKQGGAANQYPDTIATADQNPHMEEVAVEAGAHVVMSGCGATAQTGNFDGPFSPKRLEAKWAFKDLFARIIFSIGPESELVTSGIISNAAHCPGSIIKSDNFTYGEYYLILPRLDATIARFVDGAHFTPGSLDLDAAVLENVAAIGCPQDKQVSDGYLMTNPDFYEADTVNLIAKQESWEFKTSRNRMDTVWFFNFNGNPSIQVP